MGRFIAPRLFALCAAVGALLTAPARAEEARESQAYVPVQLEKDGRAPGDALEQMVTRVRADLNSERGPIVVLVHGFGQQVEGSAKNYATVAGCLRRKAGSFGLPTAVVGVHWDSDAGPLQKWMVQAAGHRLTSLLGFKKAVKNPYLEKSALASEVGRSGLRSVLFRLQDEFPGSPIHCIAHSLGAQVAVTALAPESDRDGSLPVVEPTRTLRVGMMALVGADLDTDAFARPEDPARLALRRADVWWVTVPQKGQADGVLEMRKGAGKGDAVGNGGLKLSREDLDLLLDRRGLVVDQKDIPASHALVKYLCEDRVAELTASMLYLQDPGHAAARDCTLAKLDRMLQPGAEAAPADDACSRLYATWKTQPERLSKLRVVQVTNPQPGRAGQALNRGERAPQPLGIQAAR